MQVNIEDILAPYPSILETYNRALISAKEVGLVGLDLDFFLSKNCRWWFFQNHLRVERELADQAVRSVNDMSIVPFSLSPIQMRLLNAFENRMNAGKKFRVRVMKCRRAKVSTLYLAISYHIARFGVAKKGLVFADRLETSRRLRRILDIFYMSDDLMDKPEPGKRTLAEGMYLHPAGSDKNRTDCDSFILLGSGEQKNPGIGGSLDWMVWSEASLTADAENHWTTISPSLQGALFDVAESTPSLTGQDSIIFPEFEKPSESCDRFFIPWQDVPEYRIDDPDRIKVFIPYPDHNLYGKEVEIMALHGVKIEQMLWRRFKLDELRNLNSFKQVFPSSEEEAFYASAGLFFHRSLIDMTKPEKVIPGKSFILSDQAEMGASAVENDAGIWKIWLSPTYNGRYLVVVDTAEGRSADKEGRDPDFSAVIVFRLTNPIEEVAILRERIPPEVLGEQVAAVAKYYNRALVTPERNGSGLAMMVRLMQLYSNIYQEQKLKQGIFVTTSDYGFQTTSVSKVYALSCLLTQIREKDRRLILHSEIIRLEMGKFAQQGIRYGALYGYHDDTISCLWLMAATVFQMPSLLTSSENGGFIGRSKIFKPKIERDEWNYAHS